MERVDRAERMFRDGSSCTQSLRAASPFAGGVGHTDIPGQDLSQPGVPERVKAGNLADPVCPSAVRAAGGILLDLLPDASRDRGEPR